MMVKFSCLDPYFCRRVFINPMILISQQGMLLFSPMVMSDSLWLDGLHGFPVLHYLLEFAQTHVHWVNDAIQPSHPLLLSSLSALNLSQHQGFFQWVSFSHQVAKVLELQLQHQSLKWIFRVDFLRIDWFDLAVQRTVKNLNAWSDIKVLTTCHIVNSSPIQNFMRLFLPITCMTCFLLFLL